MKPAALLLFALTLTLGSAARAQFTPAAKPAPLKTLSNSARTQFGYITVPESRSNSANTRQIKLAVIISKARSSTPEPDPVFYIVGGPGGSATFSSGGFGIFDVLNEKRDIVYVDPRGAGFSLPCLYMRKDGFTLGQFTSANKAFFQNTLGTDVSAYTTTEVAADYEAARVALGYNQINLFASSYGTFVAQEMLRRFPSSLRAVVMTGNSPATDPFLPTSLRIEAQGLDALFKDVERSPLGRKAFPRLKTRFYALVRALNQTPVKLRLPNSDTGRLKGVTIDGDEFISTVTELLQNTRTLRYIPLLVSEMEQKKYTSLVRRFFAPYKRYPQDNPFGMYLSVLGTDFAAPGYIGATSRGTRAVPEPTLRTTRTPLLIQLAQLVVIWDVPYAPGTTRTLPTSSVPTLLLNGKMDAQTPVTGGATIARGLSNATNYVYPRVGHGVGFSDGPDQDAAVAFLNNPAVKPAYSTSGLMIRDFYARTAPSSRARGIDDWRRYVLNPVPRF